ncbi:CAP domain-containing protein [uncultured Tateyamaria sp.]|uniref:CAP domain-containing protein n=1 Tax=uncultured Tateyamaria sp. TaxID=455651 RepID=UPI00260554C4|nr:CAP domain-containing protein [uncultured Tateyamaria sp.]
MRFLALVLVMVLGASAGHADPAVLAAVNAERAAKGRSALAYDAQLEAAAAAHAQDMARAGFFSHTGSDGSDISVRLQRVGYPFCFGAENIAAGQRSLNEVMAAWMGSPGHRKNILHRKAEEVGLAQGPGNHWVMVLGTRC